MSKHGFHFPQFGAIKSKRARIALVAVTLIMVAIMCVSAYALQTRPTEPSETPEIAEIQPASIGELPPQVTIASGPPPISAQIADPQQAAVVGEIAPNQVVIRFSPDTSSAERDAYLKQIGGTTTQEIQALNAVVVTLPEGADASSLPESPVVASSEPDYYVTMLTGDAPDDPLYDQQWALTVIGAPDAWAALPGDAPQYIVAVIDSGICVDHPDLAKRIGDGWDFIDNDAVPQDAAGHGCAITGIIAANANDGLGMAGMAPNTRIMPLRVLDAQGVGTYSNVAAAIVYAADHDAAIINLSLGGKNSASILEQAVNYAASKDVIIVAAAGNTGTDGVLYPAAYDSVIAVGSIDSDLRRSSFSTTGPQVDVLAPGRDILALKQDGGYAMFSGTSFAAPYVAGAVALELAQGKTLTLGGGVLSLGSAPVVEVPPAETPPTPDDSRVYRTWITLRQPYDVVRLRERGVPVYQQDGNRLLIFATRAQLADLARRQFYPEQTVDTGTLYQLALANGASGAGLDEAVVALAAPDDDLDGLTNDEESWWCTLPNDPNSDTPVDGTDTTDNPNPWDKREADLIRSGVTAYGPPFALWPQFTPANPGGNCPDGDFDAVPDYAEELIIGTSNLRESSDKDKFDDGQELFGVTYCPGTNGPCGYGILPRAEDVAYVSANLPAWVKAPGSSPWVAAFPEPEVSIVPSSIKMTATAIITTERTILNGEEHTYGTAATKGTNTSLTNTQTWNQWQETTITQPFTGQSVNDANSTTQAEADSYLRHSTTSMAKMFFDLGTLNPSFLFDLAEFTNIQLDQIELLQERVAKCKPNCPGPGVKPSTGEQVIADNIPVAERQDNAQGGNGTQYFVDNIDNSSRVTVKQYFELQHPVSTQSNTRGEAHGGSQSVTTGQYEEQTISEASTQQFSESWANATAVDTAHAADLRFTYQIVNNGTEYAREVSDLVFNVYIGDDPNPAVTYCAVGTAAGCQNGQISNLFPDESNTYTSDPIALTLDQMRAIDEGAPVRVVMEDIAFGQDQAFYQDARNGSVTVAIEDGFDDSNETIDTYLIPVWAPTDTVQDVVQRYFPTTEDNQGNLLSISTPEFQPTGPVFNQHSLSLSAWWNAYLSDGLAYNGAFKDVLAKPNATVLIRFNSDRDLDGYNDRNEIKLGTNPDDPASHPNPELLAGYTVSCTDGDNVGSQCAVLTAFQNNGNYDAYGVEAVMYTPDGLTDITNNTVGGSGRVPAGEHIVLGARILTPELGAWTGGAKPFSTGYYTGNADHTYTFTAPNNANIGQAGASLNWTCAVSGGGSCGSGSVNFGTGYQSPTPLAIAEGIQIAFRTGEIKQGESFNVQALTPRDTFQYTVTGASPADPVIVVSYNDPQGNHRFVLPPASELTSLTDNLNALSGQMIPDPGVEISSTDNNTAGFVVNSPHPLPITGAHLFVEYINSQGDVINEDDLLDTTLESGPTVLTQNINLNTYPADEFILLAFLTDSQGNIIDSTARPLASFGADPLPQANLTVSPWNSGQVSLPATQSLTDPWDAGSMQPGALMTARIKLTNSGVGMLRYALTGEDSVLDVNGVASGALAPSDSDTLTLTLNTAGLPPGQFDKTLALRTSDPANASVTVHVQGTIAIPSGSAAAYPVDPLKPWDNYVYVPSPHNLNDLVTFTHTIVDDAARIHPLYLYTQDAQTLKGVGEFGPDFTGQTAPFGVFGDGIDGDLVVSGVVYTDNVRTSLSTTANASQNQVAVADASAFGVGKEVLVIQVQGAGVGNYDFGVIQSKVSNTLTLQNNLGSTYNVGGNSKAQVIQVPHYHDVTVQNGGTLTAHAWNGSTGGIVAFKANGIVTIASGGKIDVSGLGYVGGTSSVGSAPGNGQFGKQGEGTSGPGGGATKSPNGNGGGGGQGNEGGDGGGGGGNATAGTSGNTRFNIGDGGSGGSQSGNAALSLVTFGGAGGSGGGEGNSNSSSVSGAGGNGGGVVILFVRNLQVNGSIYAKGFNGGNATRVEEGSGGGGGGAGGSIVIKALQAALGTNLINASGGSGGAKGNPSGGAGDGGGGSLGRIHIDYQTLTGGTNPPATLTPTNFYIVRQLPGLPDTDIELSVPDAVTPPGMRYYAQFGERGTFSGAEDQTYNVRLPRRVYSALNLSALVERVGGSGATFTFQLDVGNDGAYDWTDTNHSFSGPARLDTIPAQASSLKDALNTYIAANPGAGDLIIPIRVHMDTPADVFLFNLVAATGQDIDLQPSALTVDAGGFANDNIPEGTQVTLSATVMNTGSFGAESFAVSFYAVDDQQNETLIGSTFVPDLGPNVTSAVQSVTWNTTGLLGPRIVIVRVDSGDSIDEAIETNNSSSEPVTLKQKPDLTVNSVSVPDTRAGESVLISAEVNNLGEADVTGAVIALYDGDPASGGILLTSATADVLAGGSAIAQIPWTPSAAGSPILYVKADPLDAIVEADEANNVNSSMAYVGWDSLVIDAGGPPADDPAYSAAEGYGWLTEGSVVSACGTEIEQTYRQASSTSTLDYRIDNLIPGRRYHLDLTFALCSGQRQVNVFVDGRQMAEALGAPLALTGQTIQPIMISAQIQTISLLLDPADYTDRTISLSIQRAAGLGGPMVNIIDLTEIRYCYQDSGPDETPWSAENRCGYDDSLLSDAFNGWGDQPEKTARFGDTGQVQYRFSGLDAAKKYQTWLTFFEDDAVGRQERVLIDGIPSDPVTLSSTPQTRVIDIPTVAFMSDNEVVVTIERTNGTPVSPEAIVSVVALEQVTRRHIDPPVGTPASAPTDLVAVLNGAQIDLSWHDMSSDETEFQIERSSDAGTSWTAAGVAPANTANFSDQSVSCGITYQYRVRAYRASDQAVSGYSDQASATTALCPPPQAPTNLNTATGGPGQIFISWNENTDETSFRIERSPDGVNGWVEVGSVPADVVSYGDSSGLVCGTTYYYRIRAYRSGDGQYSVYSSVVSGDTQACPVPLAPSNLAANGISATQIDLNWADNSSNETSFRIERSVDGLSSWDEIAFVAANVLVYSDTSLSCGQTRFYRVRARNVSSDSPYSNIASATAAACAAPVISLSATSHNFGNQATTTTSSPFTVTVTNDGTADLNVGTLGITGDFALANDNCSGQTVAPSATCAFDVTFTPSSVGAKSGSVSIPNDASGSPHSVSLSGTGIQPAVSLSAASHDFGNQLVSTTSSGFTVTVTNNGTADLNVGTLGITGNFAFANDLCTGATVAPSATCAFDVTFTPTSVGAKAGSVTIPNDAPGSPHSVGLSGTGIPPNMLINAGMEIDANADKIPDNWKKSTTIVTTTDKQDCAIFHPGLGSCSFTIKGNGNTKKLSQTKTITLSSGTPFTFSLWVKTNLVPKAGNYAQAKLTYTDGTTKVVKFLIPLGTADWTFFTTSFSATKKVKSVQVTLTYNQTKGNIWFDDVSLTTP